MVYCELGRLPLICYRKLRIIKYWLKLKNTKNCILKSSFEYLCHEFHTKSNCKNWIAYVFNTLSEIGLRDLFLEYNHLDAKLIFPIVKQRIIDIYKQSLITEISSSSKCFMYKHLIDHIDLQTYLKKPIYNQYKKCITRLRLSSHCLSIETGRYKNIPLDRRICPMCKTDVEDEFHFVLKCPAYASLRVKFLKPYYFQRPSVFKLIQLFTSTNTKELCYLGKYIKNAFDIRKRL